MTEHQATTAQQSSREWLKVRGLQALQLTMDQILPTLGFKQSRGVVPALPHTVPSLYAEGLFTQHPNSSGQVYNLSTGVGKLQFVEERLLEAVAQLKARLEWLNSGSRLSFGVVTGRHVVMVVDSNASDPKLLRPLLEVASETITEQFRSLKKFNIIRCTNGVECWREGLVDVSDGCISDAVHWVRATPVQTAALNTSVVEALTQALTHNQVDEVYLLTQGESSLQAYDQLLQKASTSLVPLHVVAIDCLSTDSLAQYQQLATAASGRCHAYSSPSSMLQKHPLLSSTPSLSPSSPSSSPSAKLPSSDPIRPASHLPREDVLLVWKELEKTRDTLAEVQALQLEMQQTTGGGHSYHSSDEECLTSAQWLETHGIHARKLMFGDLVSSLAFRHCNGTIRLPQHTRKNATIEMIPQSKIIHAQYCKEFVHLRWRNGKVVHVQLSEHECEVYCGRVESVVRECRERLAWLKSGSRELFGTILEDKVVLVIDTSSSMGQRLELVKQKLHQLIQEQLCQKQEFTVMQFSSGVQPWREYLVPTSDQNLTAVWQWVQALRASGSTNTLEALSQATAVQGTKAVYLLTDGRPDQPPEEVLARVQEMPKIPIHTISFNCGDSKSNCFLAQLASTTGGRYYYFSEDVSDPNGPKTYQGEDIQCLEAEMTLASEQLHRAQELRRECKKAEWRGVGGKETGGRGTGGKSHENGGSVHSSFSSSGNPRSTFVSSKKWLQKHSLASLHLTLMDALGPSAIPHSPTYVPLLDRHISSRVFPSLFPLAHISSTGQKMTLINPMGPDVRQYQQQLEKQVDKYWQRLTQLAWATIPVEQRGTLGEECSVGEGEVPPYKQHRAVLRKVMEELGWPRPKEDFDLLEQEIAQAEIYKSYSTALMEESMRTQSDSPSSRGEDEEDSMTSGESLAALMDELQLHTATPSPPLQMKAGGRGGGQGRRGVRERASVGKLKRQKVIARSSSDGFYYPGLVIDYTDRCNAIVEFADGQQQCTPSRHVLAVGGAGPCPTLRLGDRVLVRVRMKKGGAHPSSSGSCDYYIPAEVRVLPADPRRGHALYSVVAFNGRSVTSARKGIMKISEARYTVTCKYIQSKLANSLVEEERTRTSIGLPQSPTHSTVTTTDIPTLSPELTNGHQSLPASPLQTVLGQQRIHKERLDQQLSAITTLQEQQMKIQAQLAESKSGKTWDEGATHSEVGKATETWTKAGKPSAVHHKESDTENDQPPSSPSTAGHFFTSSATKNGWIMGYLSQPPLHLAATCDQGINTEPWTEERGTNTDPLMESHCVGTEWSDLSSDSAEDTSPPHTPLARSPSPSVFVDGEPTPVLPSSRSSPPDPPTGQVLARWPDDGWYYRGEVVCCAGGMWYEVKDSNGDVVTLHTSDIITDSQDAQFTFNLDDTVLGLHPDYDSSYAPGQVVGVAVDGLSYTVEFYDGIQALLHHDQLYWLPRDKYESDVQYLRQKEEDWVGQAVITRRDTNGLYYPGRVLKQLLPTRHYLIQWTNGSTQEQEVVHMFGPLTRRHPIRVGDHVLALADKKHGVCMPAEICGRKSDKLLVKFCDGKKDLVDPQHCFWISKFHYYNAVDYICSTVTPSQSETPSELSTP